jgi:hypothetical protein
MLRTLVWLLLCHDHGVPTVFVIDIIIVPVFRARWGLEDSRQQCGS